MFAPSALLFLGHRSTPTLDIRGTGLSHVARDFERELEVFRTECQGAIQFFYSWQTIHVVAASDKQVQRALNDAPLFWNTSLGAMQAATFIALGRIFDPDQKNHSISRLLALGHKNLEIFSKEALADRKRKLSANADEWLPEYLKAAYVPTSEDFRRLKQHVAVRRRIYETNYKGLRHGVFAHRGALERAEVDALFAKTNIRELQQLLVFLNRLYEALWQLLFNGFKPTLRPGRYSVARMRAQPSPQRSRQGLQERLIHDTEKMLKRLSADV